ncbi:MAG: site-specific integrase [Pseudomonadaceae bacterium]|nr:site-specific integrase [Pseudomonadaceae bacterium]
MGLERRANGIWSLCEWVTDPKTGRRRRIRESSRTRDHHQAKEWYAKRLNEIWREQQLGERPPYSWKEAVVAYLITQKGKPSYEHDVRRMKLLNAVLGQYADINSITDEVISTEVLPLVADGYAPSTANRTLTTFRAVLNKARKAKRLDRLPAIEFFQVPERKPVWLEQDEIDALVAELEKSPRTKHLIDFVILAVDCGLRMRNITHLKWTDVDVQRKCVWIEKHNQKGNRHIAIPLTDAAMEVVRRNIGKHTTNVLTYRGKPYDKVNPRTLQKAADAAGVKKHVTAHVFRHTFATKLFLQGFSMFEVMELGGWSKVESVQIYTHFNPERLRATAQSASSFSREMTSGPKIEHGGESA